jgi:Hint domain
MSFLKYAHANLATSRISQSGWDDIRSKAIAPVPSFELRKAAQVVLQQYDPVQYLLSHVTIIASVDTEPSGMPTGKHMFDGFQVDRRYPDFYITQGTQKYINRNFDSWERKLLLSSYRTFVGGENYCFLPGTAILMGDGTPRVIEDVRVGDLVLTHTGASRRVLRVFHREIDEEICSLYFDRYKTPIKCTKNHPFRGLLVGSFSTRANCGSKVDSRVRYKKDVIRKFIRDEASSVRPLSVTKGWVPSSNLVLGDLVLGAEDSVSRNGGTIEEGLLLGYYLAEGCLSHSGQGAVIFVFGQHEGSLADHVEDLARKVFPHCFVSKIPRESVIRVTVRGSGISAWFGKHGGEYSESKKISEEVMSWTPDSLRAILAAWVTGDAQLHLTTKRVVGCTVSKDLAHQMLRISELVGIKSSLWSESEVGFVKRAQKPSVVSLVVGGEPRLFEVIPKHKAFNLIISKDSVPSFSELTPRWRGQKVAKLRKRSDLAWYRGVRVHTLRWKGVESYSGPVFNIEVEGDNSYVLSNGVAVHNCEHVQIPELSKGRIIDAAARDVGDSVYVDILVATDRKHKDLIEAISNGTIGTLSMGCQISYSQCTKCGNVAEDESQLCKHIRYFKGQTFLDPNGKRRKIAELCGHYSDPNSVKFIEASWVAHPAFSGAVLRSILDPKTAELAEVRQKIQAAHKRPTEVFDPSVMQKAARLAPIGVGAKAQQADHLAYLYDGPSLGTLRSPPPLSGTARAAEAHAARLQQINTAQQDFPGQAEMSGSPSSEPSTEDSTKPFKQVINDLYESLVGEVTNKVKKDISEANKGEESTLDENRSNESLIKSALRYSKWRERSKMVLANVRDPSLARNILAGLILHDHGGWEAVGRANRFSGREILVMNRLLERSERKSSMAGDARIYRTVIALGGITSYPNVDKYLAACREVLGRTLTNSEKVQLVTKGKLFSLGRR